MTNGREVKAMGIQTAGGVCYILSRESAVRGPETEMMK